VSAPFLRHHMMEDRSSRRGRKRQRRYIRPDCARGCDVVRGLAPNRCGHASEAIIDFSAVAGRNDAVQSRGAGRSGVYDVRQQVEVIREPCDEAIVVAHRDVA